MYNRTMIQGGFYFFFIIGFLLLSVPHLKAQQLAWNAPNTATNYKNPYKGNAAAMAAGKKIFNQLCHVCHGMKGKGDGVAGMSLKPRPADLTKPMVQQQPDGAIYWKITEGRPPMASYKEVLTEQQRWQLVNYIRELSKK